MKKNNEALSYSIALAVVDQLVESGITTIVASPGFRNSPLLLACYRREGMQVHSALDERGAAFLALGLIKAGSPTALLCTSGTAVANYFPAIMEAFHSHCPLVALTADRPWELVSTGANQCTDQVKIFSSHTRFFGEISCADSTITGENHARFVIAKAVAHSRDPVAGPVHVNIRFREPFLPNSEGVQQIEREREKTNSHWKFLPSSSGPGKEQWEAIQSTFHAAQRELEREML